MKIVSTGRTISTTEYLERKQKARRKRWYIACGALLALLVIAVVILRLKSFQITEIVAVGVPATGAAGVEAAAHEFLSGSYLWLVPRTNVLLYPRKGLEQVLHRKFPRLSSINLSLEGAHLLKIEGVERTPFALYCLDASTPCFFLDKTGFIFDVSPVFSDGVYVIYFSDPRIEAPLGERLVPQEEFESLAAFVAAVAAAGPRPISLNLFPTEARLFLADGATVLFPRGVDMPALARALESFLASEAIRKEKDFWQRLSTLDMRTENKVFYTFREELLD